MQNKKKHTGFALVLAWPETFCKQAGAWYDTLMHYTGINRKGYYKAGHAAIVLIDDQTGICRYFDFGRYHSPHGYGRVRNAATDHDLSIRSKALPNEDMTGIGNVEEILSEIQGNPSTHGSGTLFCAISRLNTVKALRYASRLQMKNFVPYGPFIPAGCNCSRFVNKVLLAGSPTIVQRIKLLFPLTVSPTPMWNLLAAGGKIIRYEKQSCAHKPELASRNIAIA